MLDTTNKALEFISRASLERGEWDETPMLLLINESDEVALLMLAGEAEMYEKLTAIGPLLREQGVLDGPKVTGMVLMAEAFMLKSGPQEGDRLEQDVEALKSMGLRFGDHPESVEQKMFYAIDAEGSECWFHERGGEPGIHQMEGLSMGGRIPDALSSLFELVSA